MSTQDGPWGDVHPGEFVYARQADDDRTPFAVLDPELDAPDGAVLNFDDDETPGWWQRQVRDGRDWWIPVADPSVEVEA